MSKIVARFSYYFLLTLSITGLSIAGLGCSATGSGETTDTTATTDETEYEEPTSLTAEDDGGYTAEDEETNFGIETMEQYTEDEEEEDPTVTAEEETEAEEEAGVDVYLVRIVWGNLELNARHERRDRGDEDEEETRILDWDGSLSFAGEGLLRLKRVILFEGRDHIVSEDDPKLIQWVSHTGPHIDGILAKLIVRPGTDPDVLTFETDAMTHEIALEDLDHYNEIVTLDEDGHGAAFTALKVNDDDCPEGFLEGKFHNRPGEREGGMFRGRVLSEVGALNGHIRGHYGVHEDEEVFFGKYVNHTGRFRGLLRGTYDEDSFEGDWMAADHAIEGTLNGKHVTGDDVESGFFQGFWEQSCE